MLGPITHHGQVDRRAAPADLVDALLGEAGLTGPWTVDGIAPIGWVNTNTTVRLPGGERVVVRHYGWPFAEPELFDRRAKEVWLHPVLAGAGIAVPQVLAVADAGTARGALLEWCPGEALGLVASRTGAEPLRDAWAEAGDALRRAHGLEVPTDAAGWITVDRDEGTGDPPGPRTTGFADVTFGGFHRHRIEDCASRLAPAAPALGIDVDLDRLRALAARAEPVVDATPMCFGHSDANPWNLLVTPDRAGRWRLSAFLDWEFAWVGDPAWDHMRMTVQRFADIGPTPDAWFEGYGSRPPAANLAVATLDFMLWKGLDRVDGVASRDAEVAMAWLARLPAHLDELDDLLPR